MSLIFLIGRIVVKQLDLQPYGFGINPTALHLGYVYFIITQNRQRVHFVDGNCMETHHVCMYVCVH